MSGFAKFVFVEVGYGQIKFITERERKNHMKSLSSIIHGEGGNYVAPFLWLHNEDDSLIVKELHRIHDCGIGAVCIESRTHEEFCRDDWWSDVRLIIDTCKSLGMKLWILDDKHFPSGYANGIFEKEENKHLRVTCIHTRRIDLAGPVIGGCVLADEFKSLPDDCILGAVALRRTEDGSSFDGNFIDISDSLSHGRFYFDLPEGLWAVVLLIQSQSDIVPKRRAYANHLCPEANDAYIKEVYESHYTRFKEDFGDTLLGFFSDEPSFHNFYGKDPCIVGLGDAFAGYPWHSSLMPLLEKKYGDRTKAMLCRLWYDFEDHSHCGVREHYMDTVTRLYSEHFCKRIGDWCRDHGVMYIGHVIEDNGAHRTTGYGVGHYFRALEGQDMSGLDVVLHQIVPGLTDISNTGHVSYREMDNRMFHYILGKLGSSAAHIDPLKRGRAMCEIFGAFGWAEDTEFMKGLADHFLVRGVNYFVPHAFSPKENDTDCPPNFYNTGRNPQYKYFGMLMSYMNRMCALTDGATHVPACAVVYDAEASWATKDFTDNRDICKTLYDAQLDYDLVPFDRLDDISEDGYINGEYYPVILLPYSSYYSEKNLNKLKRLKDRIVCVGERGIDGYRSVGLDGLVGYMEQYRDVTVIGKSKYIRYSHYDRGDEQCYILSAECLKKASVTLRLGGFAGGDYLVWDAFENRAELRHSDDGEIPLILYPNNLLVLFTGTDLPVGSESLIKDPEGEACELNAEWRVEYCAESELPDYKPYKTVTELKSITDPDEMPDFTGNIRYTATVTLDPTMHRVLDLGTVGQTAEVKLNGKKVGVRIFAPYRFDISDAVQEGENTLEITVANTCVFEQHDVFSRFMLIKPSGLLGPVKCYG